MSDTTVKNLTMLDILTPECVGIEFSHDGLVMWVCVDGICRLRIKGLAVEAARHALYAKLTGND